MTIWEGSDSNWLKFMEHMFWGWVELVLGKNVKSFTLPTKLLKARKTIQISNWLERLPDARCLFFFFLNGCTLSMYESNSTAKPRLLVEVCPLHLNLNSFAYPTHVRRPPPDLPQSMSPPHLAQELDEQCSSTIHPHFENRSSRLISFNGSSPINLGARWVVLVHPSFKSIQLHLWKEKDWGGFLEILKLFFKQYIIKNHYVIFTTHIYYL